MKTLWILAAAATFAACHNRADETGAAPDRGDSAAVKSGYDTTKTTPKPTTAPADTMKTDTSMPRTDTTSTTVPQTPTYDTTKTSVPQTGGYDNPSPTTPPANPAPSTGTDTTMSAPSGSSSTGTTSSDSSAKR
jgi:hypothetical protein